MAIEDAVESEFGTDIDTGFTSVVPFLIGKRPVEARANIAQPSAGSRQSY